MKTVITIVILLAASFAQAHSGGTDKKRLPSRSLDRGVSLSLIDDIHQNPLRRVFFRLLENILGIPIDISIGIPNN